MKSLIVLIAYGPNSIEMPCMLFSSKEDAIKHMSNLFNVDWEFDKNYHILESHKKDDDGDYCTYFHIYDYISHNIVGKDIHENEIFTNYYGGCGELSGLQLKEIEVSKPFIPFNLD